MSSKASHQYSYTKHFAGPQSSPSTYNLLNKNVVKISKKESTHILRENLVEMSTELQKIERNQKIETMRSVDEQKMNMNPTIYSPEIKKRIINNEPHSELNIDQSEDEYTNDKFTEDVASPSQLSQIGGTSKIELKKAKFRKLRINT